DAISPSRNPAFMLCVLSETNPITDGLIASPSAWIMRMHIAYAVDRIGAGVTFAMIVLVGPVLKKSANTARAISPQQYGNGVYRTPRKSGKPTSIAMPLTRKYEPANRGRSLSPSQPPASVARNPH